MRSVAPALALLILSACTPAAAPPTPSAPQTKPDRAARVVAALVPVVQVKGAPARRYDIAERMEHFRVPGVSVAVVDDGAVVWARGFGVTERGKAAPVTPTTLFQAASISKPVTATATLRLAEQGKLSLDEDVNHYLRSWRVPDGELTAKEKVTLRRLVSHTAGINVHGFIGYAPTDRLPTVPQILDGAAPANTPPIRVEAVPGDKLQYSGGGIVIEQLALTELTGKSFPVLMKELVLDSIGMRDSTFELPLPPSLAARACTAHDAGGAPLPGRFLIFPELAAAGLWSTPSDLLAWAIALDEARAGRSSKVLTQASAKAMLTPQKGPLGLGPILHGEGRALRFSHPGWNEGFHAEVVYFPELHQGAAVMVNGHAGRPMVREILYAIASEYSWPDFEPDSIVPFEVDAKTRDALVGTYEGKADGVTIDARVRGEGGRLSFDSKKLGVSSEVVFVSKTAFVAQDSGDAFSITLREGGAVAALDFGGIALARKESR
jgi:CubicO group peptidase (beta-lactamase class C family)